MVLPTTLPSDLYPFRDHLGFDFDFEDSECRFDGLNSELEPQKFGLEAYGLPPFPLVHPPSLSESSGSSAPSLFPSLRDSSSSSEWSISRNNSMPFTETPRSRSPATGPESVGPSPIASIDDTLMSPACFADLGPFPKHQTHEGGHQTTIRIPAYEWEYWEDMITHMHKNLSVPEIRKRMAKMGFHATEGQFAYRLRKWGVTGGTKTAHRKRSSARKTPESDGECVMPNGPGIQKRIGEKEQVGEESEVNEADKETNEAEGDEEMEAHEETDVDEESDNDSNAPTPWPEAWYEGGMELGLSQFAGRVMAEFPVQGPPCRDDHDAGTWHCPMETQTTQHPPGGSSSPRGPGSGSSTVTHSQASPPGHPQSSNHSHKRSRTGWDEDDDGPEDPRMPKRQQGPPGSTPIGGPFYACPYHKRYPHESPFCGMPHGSKRELGWDSVSRVKQHLLESHRKDHHCSNCWKAYKKIAQAASCRQSRSCEPRPMPPKFWLGDDEASRLRAVKLSSKSDDSWYRMYGIVFPDEEEHGREGYRVKYTPYYIWVDHPMPSPDSTWTPGSQPNLTGHITPRDPEPVPNAQPTPAASHEAYGLANHEQDGGPDSQDAHNSTTFAIHSPPELPMPDIPNVPAVPILPAVPIVPAVPSMPPVPSMPAVPQHHQHHQAFTFRPGPGFPVNNQTASPFLVNAQPNPDPTLLPHGMLPFHRPATPSALFDDLPLQQHQQQLHQQCSCQVVPKCVCRLQAGNDELEAENHTLRETLRGIRLELAAHGLLLREMEGGGLVGGEVMQSLWGARDRMRKLLGLYG